MDKLQIAKDVIENTDYNCKVIADSLNAAKAFILELEHSAAIKELEYALQLLELEKNREKNLLKTLFDQAGYFKED